ncbi:MAG: histidine kinase [Flavobacteriales bacterium]|nr:histidine kinase [Flavobacteriales bacterium]
MASAPAPKRNLPRRVVYWATQLCGWGLYVSLGILWNYLDDQGAAQMRPLGLVYLTGIGISHLLRSFILRKQLLQQHLGHVLPRLSLAALVLGTFAFLVEGAAHDLLLRDTTPLLTRPALDLVSRVINWTLLLLIWAIVYFGYHYFVRYRREEIRVLRLETANRENQLLNLRAQMNPHFMFNALNGIRALIDEDPAAAKRAITQLSAILRNAMATVKRTVVPLGEEIDIVKAYLALEAMRFEERLRVQFHLDPDLDRVPVPPMLLQTLVENAVRHGIARLPGGGDLIIGAERLDDGICLSVRNSGLYTPGKVNGTGIGLRNTRRRLEMIYAGKARMSISNKDGQVVTEVCLPLEVARPTTPFPTNNELERDHESPDHR